RPRAHARPELREPAGLRADGQGRLHRRPDRDAGHARSDPRGHRPVTAAPGEFTGIPIEVRRYAHGSRVPGWDRAADLTKPPEGIPDLATTPVPDELRAAIESFMAKYPERRSAALPSLMAAQKVHGWCSPEAVVQVAAVMRLTPGYLDALAKIGRAHV